MTSLAKTLLCTGLAALALGAVAPAAAAPYDASFYQGPAEMVLPDNQVRHFYSEITNTGENPDSYTLTVTQADAPEPWSFNVCYGGVCYPANQTVFTVPAEGQLPPDEDFEISFDVTSVFESGTGTYTVELVSDNDPTVRDTWTFTTQLPQEGRAMLLATGEGVRGGEINQLIGFHPVLYNAGSEPDTYTLTMTRNHPENWSSTFCYDGICYAPNVTEGQIPDGPGAIEPGGYMPIDIDFTTLFDEGPGSATINITSDADPSLFAYATYLVTTDGSVVAVDQVPSSRPLQDLRAAPNPFNPRTEIRFTVGGDGSRDALVDIYDAAGRHVRTLLARELAPGPQRVAWDGADATGTPAAAGVYLAHVRVGDVQAAVKLSLVK
jgi:hypothetical protein